MRKINLKKNQTVLLILVTTILAVGATLFILSQINSLSDEGYSILISDVWQNKLKGTEYYRALTTSCKKDQCCLQSAKKMEQGQFKLSQDGKCPAKTSPEKLLCPTSYEWCQPVPDPVVKPTK